MKNLNKFLSNIKSLKAFKMLEPRIHFSFSTIIKTKCVIIGSGIYGINISKKLSQKKIPHILLDENDENYINNSKGNSGVLHSGIYYGEKSLKRKVCMEGNILMQQYCKLNNIPINMCGKLIVPLNEIEQAKLIDLQKKFPGESKYLSTKEVEEFGGNIKKKYGALYIKNSGYSDPKLVLEAMKKDVEINYNTKVINIKESNDSIEIFTNKNNFQAEYVINCSGNYSLTIAKLFGQGIKYDSINIKANYKKIKLPKQKFLFYPAPLNFSLGVHLTPNMNDEYVKVGPSVDLNLIDIFRTSNFNSSYKFQMLKDYLNSSMLLGSLKMYSINKDFCSNDLLNLIRGKINQTLIRSPLININEGKFETDFIIENSKRSCHLLNIQSPGWTSSLALVNHLFENNIIPF